MCLFGVKSRIYIQIILGQFQNRTGKVDIWGMRFERIPILCVQLQMYTEITTQSTNQYLVAYLLSNNIEIALKFQLVCVYSSDVYYREHFGAAQSNESHIATALNLCTHMVGTRCFDTV